MLYFRAYLLWNVCGIYQMMWRQWSGQNLRLYMTLQLVSSSGNGIPALNHVLLLAGQAADGVILLVEGL